MNKHKMPTILAVATIIASSAHGQAQDENSNGASTALLEEVIVTSSRVPVPLRQTGTSVSVITAADIEAHGNLALIDVLRQLPAVAVSSNGGAGQPTSLRIRGEEGFRTLTIFDGLRLSDPSTPQVATSFEHLLSSGIGRVEILRGPQGLSYGADAGGIVNISSRRSNTGMQASLDAQGGEYGTRQYSANVGGGSARADFFVSAASYETEGFNSLTSDTVYQDKDAYENNSIHLRGGINLNEDWRLDLVHRYVDSEAAYDGCFSPTMNGNDCVSLYDLNATRVALNYEGQSFSHSFSYNTTTTDRDSLASGVSAFAAKGELNRWEYVGSASNLPGFNLVFGIDLEEALNDGAGHDNTGVYIEYLSDFSETVFLTAGVHHDDNDDFGSYNSYRVSSAYLVEMSAKRLLKFKSSYGTGFRAPSPYEIAYNAGPYSSPPASLAKLKQETSEGWEAGVEYHHGNNLSLEAVYFNQDVEDAITFDLLAYSGYLQDIGMSKSKGLELSGEYSINDSWQLRANYTYNATERPNGLSRLRRPKDLSNFGVAWYGINRRLNINAFYRMSGKSFDESAGQLVSLDDFKVLDLSANFSISATLQVYGRIENALDEKYQEVFDYNTAGNAAYLGFRMNYAGL